MSRGEIDVSPQEHYVLRVQHRKGEYRDLHNYIFTDFDHAKSWMAQKFIDSRYSVDEVEIGKTKPCKECGHSCDIPVKILRRGVLVGGTETST